MVAMHWPSLHLYYYRRDDLFTVQTLDSAVFSFFFFFSFLFFFRSFVRF